MKRKQLKEETIRVFNETRDALQAVYDALNKGQRQKLVKNAEIKALLDRYEVDYE